MHAFDPATGESIGVKALAPRRPLSAYLRAGRTTQSISTLMPPGSAATWTVVRAGLGSGKYDA